MTGRRLLRPTPTAGGARFVSYKVDPAAVRPLADDHPAVVEGHTLFRANITPAMASPRMLVSGKNNPKTGDRVTKGAWADLPIFTLTLEERATCPRECSHWGDCYGNGMHWPRRNDASDPDFIAALAAEAITLSRQHPGGFVVRLHVLGDFFSVRYVAMWAHLMAMLPGLHVFGYTARRLDSPDRHSRAIAAAVAQLNARWSRWAIRTSHDAPGPERAIVVDEDPRLADVIVCPAMVEKTAACATCGLCWAEGARDKTIAFLRHGNTRRGGRG